MCQNQVNYLICDSSGEELAPVLILLHSTGVKSSEQCTNDRAGLMCSLSHQDAHRIPRRGTDLRNLQASMMAGKAPEWMC